MSKKTEALHAELVRQFPGLSFKVSLDRPDGEDVIVTAWANVKTEGQDKRLVICKMIDGLALDGIISLTGMARVMGEEICEEIKKRIHDYDPASAYRYDPAARMQADWLGYGSDLVREQPEGGVG